MDDLAFSTPLLDFLDDRRQEASTIIEPTHRTFYLLDTLGLAYGMITELGVRTFLESAGIMIDDEIKVLITMYHTRGALEIVERYPLNSVILEEEFDMGPSFEAHLDKLRFDGPFFREQLVPNA